MSQTGNLGRSAAFVGAATLPVTGEHIFTFFADNWDCFDFSHCTF